MVPIRGPCTFCVLVAPLFSHAFSYARCSVSNQFPRTSKKSLNALHVQSSPGSRDRFTCHGTVMCSGCSVDMRHLNYANFFHRWRSIYSCQRSSTVAQRDVLKFHKSCRDSPTVAFENHLGETLRERANVVTLDHSGKPRCREASGRP